MASSNRNQYPRQENNHANLTGIPNSFSSPITKPRKHNAATAQMTPSNPSLISSNGLYGSDAPMHHLDQERQISPSAMNLDYGVNGGQDTNNELDENPRKRANNEPQDYPRRRATIAVSIIKLSYTLSFSHVLTGYSVKSAEDGNRDATVESRDASYVRSSRSNVYIENQASNWMQATRLFWSVWKEWRQFFARFMVLW